MPRFFFLCPTYHQGEACTSESTCDNLGEPLLPTMYLVRVCALLAVGRRCLECVAHNNIAVLLTIFSNNRSYHNECRLNCCDVDTAFRLNYRRDEDVFNPCGFHHSFDHDETLHQTTDNDITGIHIHTCTYHASARSNDNTINDTASNNLVENYTTSNH